MSRYGFGLDEANKTGKDLGELRGEKKRKKKGRKKHGRKMKGRE